MLFDFLILFLNNNHRIVCI